MRFGGNKSDRRMLFMELTPMIDVVFLLIIFFMTTAQFARMTRAEVDLPQERGEQDEAAQEAGLIINIDRDGSIIVNERTVAIDELEQMVREAANAEPDQDPGQMRLMIRADRNADTAVLNEVLSRLQRAGVGLTRIATEVP